MGAPSPGAASAEMKGVGLNARTLAFRAISMVLPGRVLPARAPFGGAWSPL